MAAAPILTIDDIFERLGGPSEVAKLLGFPFSSGASEMKRRQSIPVKHWPALIGEARRRGFDLDEKKLVSFHTSEPPAGSEAAA